MAPVRLKSAALWSQVKHSTTALPNLMKTPLSKVAFNDQIHFDMSYTILVVTYLEYHFVQSDLVGSGFLKAKTM